jgi:hypothetical protein
MRISCSDAIRLSLLYSLIGLNVANAQFLESELEFVAPIDSHRVLSGYAGERGSIFLTGRSESGEKTIGLYAIEQDSVNASALLRMPVPPDVLFFDAGQVGGTSELLFLTTDGISRLDVETATLIPIAAVQSIFRTGSRAPLTELDFFKDVNEDGMDDIVLADFEGLRISLQAADGFEPQILLNIRPELRLNAGGPHYQVETLHYFDFNLDGRKDLAIVRDNQFLVFEYGENGFAANAKTRAIDIELEPEDSDRYGGGVVDIDQSDYRRSQIDKVVDLNGDALPDILTITTVSAGLFNKHTEYRVHLGRKSDQGVYYLPTEDAEIPSDGIQVDLSLLGEDEAQGKDLVSTSFRIGFGEIISALFSRSIKVNVELFRIGTEPLYPPEPDYRARVRLRFSLSTGFVNVPAVRFGDFDGDGNSDLMLQEDTENLEIRLGDGRDFKSGELQWTTSLPRDGTLIKVANVNDDSAMDVLIGYGRSDGDGMRNRLRVLLGQAIEEGAQ